MSTPDVLVVGGGPGGIAAATQAAHAGLRVMLAEQRHALGGAIHRQPADEAPPVAPLPSLRGRWQALEARLATSTVQVAASHVFLGIDATGAVMLDDRVSGRLRSIRPKMLILALGALERICPRPGWQQAGVMTAGGVQVMLKEGRLPGGRILLAGSGPLLLALALQLAEAGQPPVAVIESGNPLARPLAGGRLIRPGVLRDIATLLRPILGGHFPWLRRSELLAIEPNEGGGKVALVRTPRGERRIEAEVIALHDGLRPNNFGIPSTQIPGPVVLHAGDMREVLGAHAAEADGARAGQEAVALLRDQAPAPAPSRLARERATQAALTRLFAPIAPQRLADLPDETVICRCEARTIGQLRRMLAATDPPSAREIRLNGRFCMGGCQGRFCADNVLNVLSEFRPTGEEVPASLVGQRWPLRPVSLATLAQGACGQLREENPT